MNREELIKLLQSWLTTATDDNGNPIHVIMDVDIHEIATEIIKSSLPPAEGAEEILKKHMNGRAVQEYKEELFIEYNTVVAAMTEFATLHAQRLAEKMVEDMRQKLLSMRSTKEAMDKLSKADRLMQYGYHDCINEMLMWTKNREI
jgi:hypothetical protein